MSRRRKRISAQSKPTLSGDAHARRKRWEQPATGMRRTRDRVRGWLRSNDGIVFQFVCTFGVCMVVFNVLFIVWAVPSKCFQDYLKLNAEVSGTILTILGEAVSVSGRSITSQDFSMSVGRGCEGIQVAAFFIFAVVAWPVAASGWRRPTGLAIGTLSLLTLNIVRIVSLFFIGVYFPWAFETFHVDVWQPAFIVFALALWMIWTRWAGGTEATGQHVTL